MSKPAPPGAGHGDPDEGGVDLPVPENLLQPLLEVAADTLRAMESVDVPLSLRPLHGFDRRGLLHGPGARQLRRALMQEDGFRATVLEGFVERSEVVATLDGWTVGVALERVKAAAARRDLPLLTSALWALRPDGYAFAMGAIVAVDAEERRAHGNAEATRARERAEASVAEARRRADAARIVAEADALRLAEELKQERRSRRSREDEAVAETKAALRRVEELEAQVVKADGVTQSERDRANREARRARGLEDDLQRARAEHDALQRRLDDSPSRLDTKDTQALHDAVEASHVLAKSLDALRRRVRESTPLGDTDKAAAAPTSRAPTRRVAPQLPGGVVGDTPVGLEAMLRTPGVVLVVDGYNVTKRMWPDASPSEQRDRLGIAVTELDRQLGCEIALVFDGDGTGPLPRRGRVRVLFSDAEEEADEVVVREVAALPKRVPVVVASSDGWVREHAEAQGATVVSADTLVRLLRPGSA